MFSNSQSEKFTMRNISITGYTFNINDAVLGLTFLAIGGSIPEASSAIVNARNGLLNIVPSMIYFIQANL